MRNLGLLPAIACCNETLDFHKSFCSSFSRPLRARAEAREGADPGGDAVVAAQDARVEGVGRDDGRRQDHRDGGARALRHLRLHQEQDGALPCQGQGLPLLRRLHWNGEFSYLSLS